MIYIVSLYIYMNGCSDISIYVYLDLSIWIYLERENEREIYYKELVHMIMEAGSIGRPQDRSSSELAANKLRIQNSQWFSSNTGSEVRTRRSYDIIHI